MFAIFFVVLGLVAMTTLGTHSRAPESVAAGFHRAGRQLSTAEMTRQANISLPLR